MASIPSFRPRTLALALVIGGAHACFLFASEDAARELIPFETDDAYVWMDREGVALRVAKEHVCRYANWALGTPPVVMNHSAYESFRAQHAADGDLGNWLCGKRPGEVLYSRKLEETQRAMNAARPSDFPSIPETGRYNAETLRFLVYPAERSVIRAQEGYKADYLAVLSGHLKDLAPPDSGTSDIDASISAMETAALAVRLPNPVQGCGRDLTTLREFVSCKFEPRHEAILGAETALHEFRAHADAIQARGTLTQEEVVLLAQDAAIVRRALERVRAAEERRSEMEP